MNAMMKKLMSGAAVTLALSLAPAAAFAQEEHADDVEVTIEGGTLVTEHPHPDEIWHSEEDFAKLGTSNFWNTGDPGFEHHEGLLTEGSQISMRLLDRLYYFHPDTHTSFGDTLNGEILQASTSTELFTWSNTGVMLDVDVNTDELLGIATIGSSGDLHAHADFTLSLNGGDDAPADGAYLGSFTLVSDVDGETEPIWAMWNKGLSATQFDAAILAAEAMAIPEPTTGGLLLGLAGLAMLRRRTRSFGSC